MEMPTPDEIAASAGKSVFGKPLVQNNFRSVIAEIIIGIALGKDWKHCSADWSGWDFEHESGVKLEVKQSARKQTWSTGKLCENPGFDIASRKGYWADGDLWVDKSARHAGIYVFAYHTGVDETADHRNPIQWIFYVVEAAALPPNAKTISLSVLKRMAVEASFETLAASVKEKCL